MIIPESELINYIQEVPEDVHRNFKNKVGQRIFYLEVMYFAGLHVRDNKGNRIAHYVCKCDCGNYCVLPTGSLRSKIKSTGSCGCMQGHQGVTEDTITERTNILERDTPYKVVNAYDGKYDTKWLLSCSTHGNFKSRWGNVVDEGTACPRCACLSRGFNQMIPGHLYINLLKDNDGNEVAIKYGVTNSTPDKRKEWLAFGTNYLIDTVFSRRFDLGYDALQLEAEFRKLFGTRFLTKEELSVGFTETTHPSNLKDCISHALNYIPVGHDD